MIKKRVILIGGGGHAKVLYEIIKFHNLEVEAICSPCNVVPALNSYPCLRSDEEVLNYSPREFTLVNGIGSVSLPYKRKSIYEYFKNNGYEFNTLIHPSAIISSDVEISEGAQIMAGSVIQTGTKIGFNTIINTRASIDHDCQIGSHAHIAPGVTLSGDVHVGETVHIGTGTTVIQGISIGSGSLIGAASLVLKNFGEGLTAYGIPAKEA